jgi:hypothetical protein
VFFENNTALFGLKPLMPFEKRRASLHARRRAGSTGIFHRAASFAIVGM